MKQSFPTYLCGLILCAMLLAPAAPAKEKPATDTKAKQATLGDLACSTSQIALFDGTNWVCSPLPSGVGPVVFDGDTPPKPVGKFLLLDSGLQVAVIQITLSDPNGVDRQFPLLVHRDYGLQGTQRLIYWTEPDCTGTPFLERSKSGLRHPFPGIGETTATAFRSDGRLELYTPTSQTPIPISVQSVSDDADSGSGPCYPAFRPPSEGVPVELMHPDLNLLYPGPFNVVP